MFDEVVKYGNGHYLSHIRCSNGQWETQNDWTEKILNSNSSPKPNL